MRLAKLLLPELEKWLTKVAFSNLFSVNSKIFVDMELWQKLIDLQSAHQTLQSLTIKNKPMLLLKATYHSNSNSPKIRTTLISNQLAVMILRANSSTTYLLIQK